MIFMTVVNSAGEARQVRFMIESLRRFGGELSDSSVMIFRPVDSTADLPHLEHVDILPLEIEASCRQFPLTDKVFACARAEALVGGQSGSLAWISQDCLFVNPRTAGEQSIPDGGWMWVESPWGKVRCMARYSEAVEPGTVWTWNAIGKAPGPGAAAAFTQAMKPWLGTLQIPGIESPLAVTDALLGRVADRYLTAVTEAAGVYRHIASRRSPDSFITEVSFDEAGEAQSPEELLFILAGLAREGVPLQTVAPKFTGAFLKGVDYVGDRDRFAAEFAAHLAVTSFAAREFHLPPYLKLSVHTGSDKFSLYPAMHRALRSSGAGLHLKTAGTTWLEEVVGLASSGGAGLELAKEIYTQACARYDELSKPYLTVIHIDRAKLPPPGVVQGWSAEQFTGALRHDPSCRAFDTNFRQLLHIAFRVAAEMGPRFEEQLSACRREIEANVTANLYDRHIAPLFLGTDGRRPVSVTH